MQTAAALNIELFSLWTPLHAFDTQVGLSKAGVRMPPPGSPAYKNAPQNGGNASPLLLPVGGVISSQARDQQGEVILQDGVDWQYFLSKGHVNYEHLQGPDNVIGYPESIERVMLQSEPATSFKGYLYGHDERARRAYDTAVVMRKSGGARNLGFSVEGAVLAREGPDKKTIAKSRVLNVALTAHPVHPDARLEVLARSLLVADRLHKAGEIGYQTPAGTTGSNLSVLVAQSLGSPKSTATYGAGQTSLGTLKDQIRSVFPGVSDSQAAELARQLFALAS